MFTSLNLINCKQIKENYLPVSNLTQSISNHATGRSSPDHYEVVLLGRVIVGVREHSPGSGKPIFLVLLLVASPNLRFDSLVVVPVFGEGRVVVANSGPVILAGNRWSTLMMINVRRNQSRSHCRQRRVGRKNGPKVGQTVACPGLGSLPEVQVVLQQRVRVEVGRSWQPEVGSRQGRSSLGYLEK